MYNVHISSEYIIIYIVMNERVLCIPRESVFLELEMRRFRDENHTCRQVHQFTVGGRFCRGGAGRERAGQRRVNTDSHTMDANRSNFDQKLS